MIVLASEGMRLLVILLLMHGDLFMICDDISHCYLEKMSECLVRDGLHDLEYDLSGQRQVLMLILNILVLLKGNDGKHLSSH